MPKEDQEMAPLTITAQGWWALLIRVQAALFPPLLLLCLGFFVWQVKTLARHETEIAKLEQWKSQFIGYPPDAKDLAVRIQSSTDAQLANLATRIEALNVTLAEIKVRQSIK